VKLGLTLEEEHRWGLFENRMLRRILDLRLRKGAGV